MMTQLPALAAMLLAVAGGATSCPDQPVGTTGTGSGSATNGVVVNSHGFQRVGAGDPGTHYAECATSTGEQYRIQISKAAEFKLSPGDPCPNGRRLPMPDPATVKELTDALNEPLPYAGGDTRGPCGAWEVRDKEEARQLAKTCGPLTRGDLR